MPPIATKMPPSLRPSSIPGWTIIAASLAWLPTISQWLLTHMLQHLPCVANPKMKGYPGYPCAENKFNSLILNFNKRRLGGVKFFGYGSPFQFKIFNYMKPTCTIGSIIEQKSSRKPESTNFMLSLIPSVNEFASTLNPSILQSWTSNRNKLQILKNRP